MITCEPFPASVHLLTINLEHQLNRFGEAVMIHLGFLVVVEFCFAGASVQQVKLICVWGAVPLKVV